MTLFSRAVSALLTLLFGRVAVREHHFPRALRIFRATLEENGFNPDYLPEGAHEALMIEITERARKRDSGEVLRWKHLMAEILSMGNAVCLALKGTPIDDKRVSGILMLHKVI